MDTSLINTKDNSERQITLENSEEDKSIYDLLNNFSSQPVCKKSIGSLHYYVFEQSGIHKDSKISLFNVYKDKNDKTIIKTNNYAGFIGAKNREHHITLNIHSRFDETEKTKDYFLYYILFKTQGINLSNIPPECNITLDSYFHLLMLLFPELLVNAFAKGVFRKYVTKFTNGNFIQGRINFKRHIRLNMCPPQARIACDSRQLSADNDVLQLIRHALEKIDRDILGHYLLTSNERIRNCVEELKAYTSSYSPNDRRRVIVSNLKTVIHPLYQEYSELQRLSMAILRDEDLTYSEHSNSCPYGIFFDLAELWESYLATLLKPLGYTHHVYKGKNNKNLFNDYSWPVIIPDYVKEGKKNYIADAKYIRLDEYFSNKLKSDKSDDRDIGIIYKTITYMHSYSCHSAFLFYPVNFDTHFPNKDSDIFKLNINDTNDIIHVIGLNIPLSCNSINFKDYVKKISDNEKTFIDKVKEIESSE